MRSPWLADSVMGSEDGMVLWMAKTVLEKGVTPWLWASANPVRQLLWCYASSSIHSPRPRTYEMTYRLLHSGKHG